MATSPDVSALDVFFESPEFLAPSTSRAITCRIGERTQFVGTLNGKEIDAWVTFHSASLTRVTQIVNTRMGEGGSQVPYNLATGVFRNVGLDLELTVDGVVLPIEEFLLNLINAQAEAKGANPMQLDHFLQLASNIGFDFQGTGPLMWQHFGASQAGLNEAFQLMIDSGGEDATHTVDPDRRGRIQRIVTHPGLHVTSLEMGRADRTASERGQGFLDLVDAIVSNFIRVLNLRKQVGVMNVEFQEKLASDPDFADTEAGKEVAAQISTLRRASTSWASNWAGAQQRLVRRADGSGFDPADQWDQVSMPCGRVGVKIPVVETRTDTNGNVVVDAHGKPVHFIPEVEMRDANGDLVLDANGVVKTEPAWKEGMIDLWPRADAQNAPVVSGLTTEIDTTKQTDLRTETKF